MVTGMRLDLRQTQGLVLTPQLQQAIRLLQMSNVELSAAVDREITENPFLDRVDGSAGPAVGPTPEPTPRAGPGPIERDEGWWQPPAGRAADSSLRLRRTSGQQGEGDLPSLEARLAQPRGLREHLVDQLGTVREPELRALAATLIDWLDPDGYLREGDEELAEALGTSARRVASARRALQGCDPPGIGARDLAECLALQLRERDRLDPAMRALLANLGTLARADMPELMRRCGVDAEDLQDMVQELRRLEPRPARGFGADEALAVIPDVLVHAGPGGTWRVELNAGTLPRVLVDRSYHAEVAGRGVERPGPRLPRTSASRRRAGSPRRSTSGPAPCSRSRGRSSRGSAASSSRGRRGCGRSCCATSPRRPACTRAR